MRNAKFSLSAIPPKPLPVPTLLPEPKVVCVGEVHNTSLYRCYMVKSVLSKYKAGWSVLSYIQHLKTFPNDVGLNFKEKVFENTNA